MDKSSAKRNQHALGFLFGVAMFGGFCVFVMNVFQDHGLMNAPEVQVRNPLSTNVDNHTTGATSGGEGSPAPQASGGGGGGGATGMMAPPNEGDTDAVPVPLPAPSEEAERRMRRPSGALGF